MSKETYQGAEARRKIRNLIRDTFPNAKITECHGPKSNGQIFATFRWKRSEYFLREKPDVQTIEHVLTWHKAVNGRPRKIRVEELLVSA